MIALIAKLSRTCYGELTPYALLNSSVLRWLLRQDDDEDKSRTAADRVPSCTTTGIEARDS